MPFLDLHCPYCGEATSVFVDASSGSHGYVEDCQVCCRPIEMQVDVDAVGDVALHGRAEDEA